MLSFPVSEQTIINLFANHDISYEGVVALTSQEWAAQHLVSPQQSSLPQESQASFCENCFSYDSLHQCCQHHSNIQNGTFKAIQTGDMACEHYEPSLPTFL